MKMNYVNESGDTLKNYILRGLKIETFCDDRLKKLFLRSMGTID